MQSRRPGGSARDLSGAGGGRLRVEERLARRGGAIEWLRAPAALFGGLARVRAALYDRRLLPVVRVAAPVVSVGNLTVGGTGKTPAVIAIARELARRGRRPGVLARGYRRAAREGSNDEGRLLARKLPGVPYLERADRVEGAQKLVDAGCDVIVLDDGFQHRRLARDLDLVLVDATRPFGLPPSAAGEPAVRALLPRGLLREPPGALARADALAITRADQVPPEALDALERELWQLAPGRPILRAAHRPRALRGPAREEPPEALAGRPVRLVSGIGNPAAFERTAHALGARVVGVHRFGDHHDFRREELEPLLAPGVPLLVTAKDAVKLEALGVPHLTLDVEWTWLSGEEVLEALLDALPPSEGESRRAAAHGGLSG